MFMRKDRKDEEDHFDDDASSVIGVSGKKISHQQRMRMATEIEQLPSILNQVAPLQILTTTISAIEELLRRELYK